MAVTSLLIESIAWSTGDFSRYALSAFRRPTFLDLPRDPFSPRGCDRRSHRSASTCRPHSSAACLPAQTRCPGGSRTSEDVVEHQVVLAGPRSLVARVHLARCSRTYRGPVAGDHLLDDDDDDKLPDVVVVDAEEPRKGGKGGRDPPSRQDLAERALGRAR